MTRISLFSLLVFLSGCVYVPPVWDAWDEIYDLDFIEPGVTTKHQVLGRLGEPDTSYEGDTGSRFSYSGEKSSGGIFGYGIAVPIASSDWRVTIRFDENDVVREVWVDTAEPGAYTRPKYTSPDYHINLRMTENFNTQLKKACGGDKAAQYLIAQYYDRGEGTKRDKVEALKWYSLVEEEWPEAIKYFQDKLRQEMTSSEIAEAERLAAEWVPNREDCDR